MRSVRWIWATSLALLGGLGGVLLAPGLIATLVSLYPTTLPRMAEIGLELRGVGVAAMATLLTAVLMAIPLVRATMRATTRGTTRGGQMQGRQGDRAIGGRSDRRLTRVLVVVQVSLSVVLLSAGALLTRTFLSSASTDVGFDHAGTLVFNISPASSRYPTPEALQVFSDQLLGEFARVPGVRAVGMTQFLPFSPGMWGDNLARVGTHDQAPNLPDANLQFISPGFPAALGLTVAAGRGFAEGDRLGAPLVAMVNETVARRWFDGAPVGRRVVVNDQTWEIVGVLSDKRHASLTELPRPELYMPWNQFGRAGGWVVIRTDGSPMSVTPAVREALQGVDPTIAITRLWTLDATLAQAMAPERFRATLAAALGGVALCLVVIGLYGVMAHTVARRTREIGVRLALGESPARVGQQILRGAFGLALGGVAIGVGLSLLLAPQLQSFLSDGLRASDPLTMSVWSAGLILIGVASAIVPARRASRIDPIAALRES